MRKLKYVCLGLVCCLLLGAISVGMVGCSGSGKTLLKLGEQKITLNEYELLLSRMKGKLEYNDYPVDTEEFWKTIISEQGATYDDYFRQAILEEAKYMLVKLYIFEEVYKLTLPKSYTEDIDTYISDIMLSDEYANETAFNRVLASYGANVSVLKNNYVTEDKIDYLLSYISNNTADSAREEYYNNNYYHFKHILFPLYEYDYETDENGDLIYYQNGTGSIAYDTTKTPKKGTDGNLLTDDKGQTIFYLEDGRIAYDTVNGVLMAKDKDNDGYPDYTELSDEKKTIVKEKAEQIQSLIQPGDFSTFVSYGDMLSEDETWKDYPNGIYIHKDTAYSEEYLTLIQTNLSKMEVGDVALIQSDLAYHLIMKYDLVSGAYSDTNNEDWFGTFESNLTYQILDSLCEKYIDDIEYNEDVYKKAPTMMEIGSNMKY